MQNKDNQKLFVKCLFATESHIYKELTNGLANKAMASPHRLDMMKAAFIRSLRSRALLLFQKRS
jgi:hypothetical protein